MNVYLGFFNLNIQALLFLQRSLLSVTSLAAQACSGLKWFCDLVNYSLAQMLSAFAENEDW